MINKIVNINKINQFIKEISKIKIKNIINKIKIYNNLTKHKFNQNNNNNNKWLIKIMFNKMLFSNKI